RAPLWVRRRSVASSRAVEPTIAVLSPELASRIAAGEVVERPASVARELIENALDAGATRIEVTVEGGGIGLIEVADDGRGMAPEDARLSIERHATSKLRRFSDLDDLWSCGCRGAALPSIASVSRFTLRTRTADSDEALELITEGASEPRVRPAAGPVGTTVRVADLFYNVPARRKFLRSTGTEAGHVGDVVLDAALCRPDVAFTLVRDGRQVRSWSRARDREERVRQLLGEEELIECRGERGPLTVLALLSRPERARQGATGLKVLVNGRPVRDRGLAGTIAHAYGSILERGRYPRGVVYLELPGHLVDVNVHPQKLEVRFADPRAVSDAVYGIVSRGLASALGGAPPASRDAEPTPVARAHTPPENNRLRDSAVRVVHTGSSPPSGRRYAAVMERLLGPTDPTAAQPEMFTPRPSAPSQPERSSHASSLNDAGPTARSWHKLRFIEQLKQTFLLCEGEDGLYVLDQHAAAERVIFSRLRHGYQSRTVATQALLFPLIVDVTAEEADLLDERNQEFAALGLDVRLRGREQASVDGVPRLLALVSPERLLRDLLRERSRKDERAYSDAIDKVLATMACHAAVRAGDVLSAVEASGLLRDLDGADFAGYCPHGRP